MWYGRLYQPLKVRLAVDKLVAELPGNWRLWRRRYRTGNGWCHNQQEMGANVPNRGTKTALSGSLTAQVAVYYGLISRVIIRGRSMSEKRIQMAPDQYFNADGTRRINWHSG